MNEDVVKNGICVVPAAGKYRRLMLLAVLVSAGPLMGLIIVGIAPVLPMLAQIYGAGSAGSWKAQLLLTVPSMGIMLGGPLTGWLVERVGVRRMSLIGFATYTVAGAAGMVSLNLWLLLPTRLLVGLGAVAVGTSSMALLATHYTDEERARILGYQGAFGSAFGIAGFLIAGELGERFGIRANFALYLGAAILFLLAFIAVPSSPVRVDSRPTAVRQSLLSLWPLYVFLTLLFCASFMPSVQLGFLLVHDGVSSAATISQVLAGGALGTATGSWAYGRLVSRLGYDWIFPLSLFTWASGLLIVGWASGIALIACGTVLAGLGFGLFMPYAAGLLLRKAPPTARGRAMGFYYTAIYLGDFISPFVAMSLRDMVGIHGLFLVIGLTIVLVGAGSLLKRALYPSM